MTESFDLDAASGDAAEVATAEAVPTSSMDDSVGGFADDVSSATEAVPAAAEATPEPELPMYEPTSWLDSMAGAMNPTPPPPPPGYPPQYPPQPPQYAPPPPQQSPPQSSLDGLLENPDQYISRIAAQAAAPQQQYINQMEDRVGKLMADSANKAYGSARQSIEEGYRTVLNNDNTFRGNENVRHAIDGMLQRAMWSVQQGIANGNFNAGQALADPTFFPTLLHAAKLKAGVGFQAPGAATPAGANIESVTPPAHQESGTSLDPDLQGVANALGPAFERELKAAVASAEKHGDMVW